MNVLHRINEWFNRRAERRRSRRLFRQQMQQMQAIAVVFETLNKFHQAGLLYVDFKRHNITISILLAGYYVCDEQAWQNFLHNLHQWAVYQYSINDYVRAYGKAMADAEARATGEGVPPDDRTSRRAVRMEAVERLMSAERPEGSLLPDLQFIVLGAADGHPILVSQLVDGQYTTLPIPDQLKPASSDGTPQ